MTILATEAIHVQLRIILKEREDMFDVARLQDMERFYYQNGIKLRIFTLCDAIPGLREHLGRRLRECALVFVWYD